MDSPRSRAWLLAPLALVGLISTASGEGPNRTPLAIGSKAPAFSLPGVDGKTYTLDSFKDAKVVAVVFTCNHCPTAQAYEDRLIKIRADYKDRGVALVAISPNDPLAVRLDELGYTDLDDSFEHMKIRAKDKKYNFPYLYDGETQKTSSEFGVLATPHVFIFDEARTLRYAGRVDDAEVKTVKSHDARNAIEALLAGKPVPVETTRVPGCSTKWSDKRQSAKDSLAKWDAEDATLEPIAPKGVKALAANDTKNWRLVNVWATWCGPCVEELPQLTTMHRMYRRRNFELITISLDDPKKSDPALAALKKEHLSTKNYLFHGENQDALFDALDPKAPGPVPYTLLIAPGGKVVYRKSGAFDPMEVRRVIADHIGRTY